PASVAHAGAAKQWEADGIRGSVLRMPSGPHSVYLAPCSPLLPVVTSVSTEEDVMSEVQAGVPLVESNVPAKAVITPPRVRANASVRTYRYLRLSLVGLVFLLLFCVWLERLTGDPANRHLGSISAYYYTPARSVFVGALVAIGISLAAIV